MGKFVEISALQLEDHLVKKGFRRVIDRGNEVVYEFSLQEDNRIVIKVYTSIKQDSNVARDVGKDAIRVIAIFDKGDKTFPLFKGQRVFRTTSTNSVINRIDNRINLAKNRCLEWLYNNVSTSVVKTVPRSPESTGKTGKIGDTLRITAVVTSIKQYGAKYLVVMNGIVREQMFVSKEDRTTDIGKQGVFIYWTPLNRLQVDEIYELRCVIK